MEAVTSIIVIPRESEVISGSELITLIMYPAPPGSVSGILVIVNVPLKELVNVPILVGDAKLPVASES
jgi:hypothetical protein